MNNTLLANQTCRLSSLGKPVDVNAFRSIACIQCLLYIYLAQPPYNFTEDNVCLDGIMLCDPKLPTCKCDNQPKYNLLDFSRDKQLAFPLSDMNLDPMLPENFEETVRECCNAAKQCCDNHLKFDIHADDSCAATWDGWSCFERSKPGIVRASCPNYVFGQRWYLKNNEKAVIKRCKIDGHWDRVVFNDVEKERTDYSHCHREEPWLKPVLILTFAAYCISAVALFPALMVLTCNRRLRNYNIFSIHRQLLLSIFLSSTLYIVNALLFLPLFKLRADLFLQNHIICRILFIVQFAYLRLTTFAWMLVEALHLYWLLFQTNTQMTSELSSELMLLTWGIPALISTAYALLLEFYDNRSCMPESKNMLINALIMLPCAFCLLVNMTILVGTLRLLLEKLRTDQNSSRLHHYKKILRALLVLIPLFGINLMFDIYSTEADWHDILNTFLNALNGLVISLIVVYCNNTVIRFMVDSLKQLEIEIDSGFIRLSVSDYFRSHSVGCRHEQTQKSSSIRFASI